MTDHSFLYYWFLLFGIILARYLLLAGGAYFFFYSTPRKLVKKRELRLKPPLGQAIRKDIELSTLSAIVFAICSAFILSAYDSGATLLYTNPAEHGLWYLGASFLGVLFLQDTYFYFVHRAFHHPLLFKSLHYGHHRCGDPTPWTSFAFDPLEAIVQASFFIVLVFVIPLHFATLIAVLTTMTVWSVLNHLGFELFSPSFPRHWLGKWLIGPTHHSIHHRKYVVHYGLYFTIWDRLLRTHDPSYENDFDSSLRGNLKSRSSNQLLLPKAHHRQTDKSCGGLR